MARKTVKRARPPVYAETGAVRKPHAGRLTVALVYPNIYAVGMSNLGFLTVYRLLNGFDQVACERAFLPSGKEDPDRGVKTVESGKPIGAFDIVAFSLSFENDYPAIPAILEKAGLPLASSERGSPHPLVLAGGVACFLNPEPIAAFIDCFLLGEAEVSLPLFLDACDFRLDRQACLSRIARRVPGAYVPVFYSPVYRADGTLETVTVAGGAPRTVKPPRFENLAAEPAYNTVMTPDTAFNDTCLVEVARGCPHGCRFCSAGFVYRPPRFQSLEALTTCLERAARHTSRVGLVGTAVSDLPHLNEICRLANDQGLRVSFSSLRADALDRDLVATLRASRVKTATIAPDAGSERMRRRINKGLSEEQILAAAEMLVAGGIPNLKVYFMVGLPWETAADVQAIVNLTGKIKQRFLETSRKQKKIGSITVSLNAFVPKPFTPFQWCPMEDRKSLQTKIRTIQKALGKVPNVRVQAQNLRWSYIQALLARGDRRVAELLRQVHANQGNWSQTLKATTLEPDFYVTRSRALEERLPWYFIDHGLSSRFLRREYRRAQKAQSSPECPLEDCRRCGLCR